MAQQGSPDEIISLPNFDDDDDPTAFSGPNRPRRRGRWILLVAILLLIAIVVGLFLTIRPGRNSVTYQYQKLSQGNFSLSVNATGPLQSGSYNLVFSGTGKIAEIDVTVGQTVKQGQVLARLDKTSLQDAINTAQAQVLSAQAILNGDQTSYSKTQAQSQASVSGAQTTLTNAQDNLTTTQQQSQTSINGAQTSLNDAQTNLAKTKTESNASIAAAQTALNNAQSNLRNVQNQSRTSIATAKVQETQAIAACNATPAPTPTPTPTPSPDCVKLAQDQYNQAVATANANVATAQNLVTTDQKALTTAQAQASSNIATAQGQVNTAQSQLNTAMAQSNSNNTTAQGQINTAQSQLNTALAQADTNNTTALNLINTAQGTVNADLAQLQTAQHNLNNATLTAPHDGIVTTINGTVGGTPGVPVNASATSVASGTTFIQIEDTAVLQVLANVNESDTGNLTVGEPAQFTVSAYGQRIFHGTVSAITPNGQTVSNVVTYPVTIDVDKSTLNGATLFPGMTANVTIIVAQRPNGLIVPASAVNFARTASNPTNGTSAIVSKDQTASAMDQARQMLQGLETQNANVSNDNPIPAYVLEQQNGQFILKPVVLGLTDGVVYEVLAGLSPGETIIIGSTAG